MIVDARENIILLPGMSIMSHRQQLDRGRFFEGLQNYTENKNEGIKNKIIFADLIV